jgi:hypothetical protein
MAANLFRSARGAQNQPWTEESSFELPEVVVNWSLEDDTRFLDMKDKVREFFAVKFCPYQPLDQSPIFAAVSKKHVRSLTSLIKRVNSLVSHSYSDLRTGRRLQAIPGPGH